MTERFDERTDRDVPPSTVLSVVVPTFNRLRSLQRTLAALARQDGLDAPWEVIVVSDGSTDGTDQYLASGSLPLAVVARYQPNGGPAAARNLGVAAARGDVLVFIDDDVVPAPDLLAAHLRHHRRSDGDLVVIGPMRTPANEELSPWIQWEQMMLEKQYDAMDRGIYGATPRQFFTGNASVARRHVDAAGGFDPSFRRAEDVELAYRLADLGLHFEWAPDAVVEHHAERSLRAWEQAATAYGHNDVIFGRDLGRQWLLDSISAEYWGRNRLVRTLTRVCLPRPRVAAAASWTLSRLAQVAAATSAARVAHAALSAVYNLAYYGGMADEMGSATALFQRFDRAAG